MKIEVPTFDVVESLKQIIPSKSYSDLELMVIEDMHEQNIDYPFCSVDDVKIFWRKKGVTYERRNIY